VWGSNYGWGVYICDIGLASFCPKYLSRSRQEPFGGVIAARSKL
jgi:hypothetical protein